MNDKKKIKRKHLLSLTLAIVMLFSGCGGKPSNGQNGGDPDNGREPETAPAAMGRYVEEELAFPAQQGIFLSGREGRLEYFTYENGAMKRYVSENGEIWTEEEMPGFAALGEGQSGGDFVEEGQYFQTAAVDGDTIYLAGTRGDLSKASVYCSRDNGATFEAFPMEGCDEVNDRGFAKCIPGGILPLGEGKLLVLQRLGAAGIYDGQDGHLITEMEAEETIGAVYGESIVLPNADWTGFSLYDPETGKETEELPYDGSLSGTNLFTGNDGALYLVNRGGIHRRAVGSGIWETLVDGTLTSLGMPSMYAGNALEGRDGALYVSLQKGDGENVLMRYRYDAAIPSVPDTELVVYSLENNATVRQAIGEFQRENPSVRVNYRVGMSDGAGGVTKSDLIRALNTELLAGKGPDVLILDGMPIDSYVEKGVLMDLSGILQEGIASGALGENLMNAYAKDGKRYAVPSRIEVPVILGPAAALESAGSLQALADAAEAYRAGHSEGQLLGVTAYGSAADRIEQFYPVCAPAWFEEDGSLNEEKLAEFLTLIRRIMEACSGSRQEAFDEAMESAAGLYGDDGDVVRRSGKAVASLSDMLHGYSALHIDTAKAFFDLMEYYGALNEVEDGRIAPLCGQVSNVYFPRGILGINAASSQTELAGKFVQQILSEKVQDTELYDGFPVNRNSRNKKTDEEKSVSVGNRVGEYEVNGEWPSKEQLKEMAALCETLTIPANVDETLLSMIEEESEAFFAGQMTAEQAARAIAERARAYLAE